MQADDFEKKIQSKMDEFELVPDGNVWKQVSFEIEREKKKRRILLYWFAGVFILLGATSVFIFTTNENSNKTTINTVNNNIKNIDNTIELNNLEAKQHTNDSKQSLHKMSKTELLKNITSLKKDNLRQKKHTEIKTADVAKNINTGVVNKKFSQTAQFQNRLKEEKPMRDTLPFHKFYNPNAAALVINEKSKNRITKDTSVNTIALKTITENKTVRKWHYGVTVYSGISDNVSGLPLSNKSYLNNYASPITSGGSANSSNVSYNFKRGFSFGIGTFIKRRLDKKISLTAGLDYHYYSAKSAVGEKVNAPGTIYDSAIQYQIRFDEYYNTGSTVNYTNKYHLLQLPINIGYQINKNQEKLFVISAGVSPGYLLASNALYANTSANRYYTDKKNFNRFQLAAQSSLLFAVIGSRHFYISAGPALKYEIINTTKATTTGDRHLFFAGLKANINFK